MEAIKPKSSEDSTKQNETNKKQVTFKSNGLPKLNEKMEPWPLFEESTILLDAPPKEPKDSKKEILSLITEEKGSLINITKDEVLFIGPIKPSESQPLSLLDSPQTQPKEEKKEKELNIIQPYKTMQEKITEGSGVLTNDDIESILKNVDIIRKGIKSVAFEQGPPAIVCVLITSDGRYFMIPEETQSSRVCAMGFWEIAEQKAFVSLLMSSDHLSVPSKCNCFFYGGKCNNVAAGGLPIYKENKLAGGLGISGDHPSIDEQIGKRALVKSKLSHRTKNDVIDASTLVTFSSIRFGHKIRKGSDSIEENTKIMPDDVYKIARLKLRPKIGFVFDKTKPDNLHFYCKHIYYNVDKLEKWAQVPISIQYPCPKCYFK